MTFNVHQVAEEFSILNRQVGDRPLHYMDSAATAQMPDCVIEAVALHDRTRRANVKRGVHLLSEEADEAYEDARAVVARYLGVPASEEVIFTGGTTAGINLLAQGLGETMRPGDEILISQLEHHSNIVPWQMLRERRGITLRFLPVTDEGALDLNDLDRYITAQTRLVALTHGSNVTGALTEVAAIRDRARETGALVMLDGAQRAPHGPIDLPSLGVDYYVFSGHKAYGPSGIGILWGRGELLDAMTPAFGGGEMIDCVELEKSTYAPPPHRFEAGTPPITQAVGLAAALQWLSTQDIEGMHRHLADLAEQVMEGLEDMGGAGIRILGPPRGTERLPLISFAVDDIHPHDICQVMSDHHGVALRGGHHCAQPLHDHFDLDGTTRASLAAYSRQGDVDAFLEGMDHCMEMFA